MRTKLQGEGCTITKAGVGLSIGLPTLSHHIKELQKAGLISIKRKGQEKRCWIASEGFSEMHMFFLSLGPR